MNMCTTLSFREVKDFYCPNFSLFFYSWVFFVLLIPWKASSANLPPPCQPTTGYYEEDLCDGCGVTYTVGNDTYDQDNPTGTTILPNANSQGCDSIVHVTLNFYPNSFCYHTKVFCAGSGDSYTVGTDTYDEDNPSGITLLAGANQYGCDSIVHVTLIYAPPTEGTYEASFCQGSGDSYTVGGDTYDEDNPSGSTLLPGANENGCDSTVHVALTYYPSTSADVVLTYCEGSGATYTIGGDTYDEDNAWGYTTLPGANQYGCDSIVQVDLVFLPNSSSDYEEEFCEGSGGSYTVGSDTYDEDNPSGSTTLVGANYLGCDSTVNVTLTFNPSTSADVVLTYCEGSGATYTIGGDTYDEDNAWGYTTLPGANQYGCDSIVQVDLVFLPNSSSDYEEEFCEGSGGSYTVGSDTYDEDNPSGSTTLVGANYLGCDSTVNVTLTFNPSTSADVVLTYCEGSGATYTIGGDTYDEDNAWGYTTLPGANQYGCDSIVQVDLVFLPNSSSDYMAEFCEGSGDSYTVGTDTYDEDTPSGSTTLIGANYLGCDSTVNVTLIFNPTSSSDYAETFCAGSGGSYTVGGDTYNEDNPSGSTTLIGANQYGCDSTVNVILTFNPTTFCYHTKTFCEGSGDTYTAGGTTFDEDNPEGVVILPGANQYGCDSTIYVTLTFLPNSFSDYTAEFCEGSGGSYTVGADTYDEDNPSGSTTLPGASYLGCDSTVNVTLTFNPSTSADVVLTYCEGSGATYTVGGDTYDENNAWGYTTLPGANQYGCDSIVQVDLVFLPNSSSDYTAEFCQGSGGSYTVGTDTYDEGNPSGSTTLVGANYLGCDSTVNVTLIFNPATSSTIEESYCKSSGYSLTIGSDTYDKDNPSGSTTLPGANQYGCDSTVYVNLTFLNRGHKYIETTHCKSDGYSLTVGSDVYDYNNPSGNTNLPGANYQGCDSIVHVNLTFLNRTHSYIETTHCKSDGYSLTVGDDVYDYNNPSGNTNLQGAGYLGCDSIVHVNLTFLNRTHSYIETTHCKSDGYSLTVGDDVYDYNNPSGNTNLQGAGYLGCDSIVHVNLTFLNRTHKYIETEHCENSGYSLTVGDDVYDIDNPSGNTNLKYANYQGCDSIVHVNLTFNPTSDGSYSETFCEGSGGSYTVGGYTYDEDNPSGSTILLGANQYGCDSTVYVTLTFLPNSESTYSASLCTDSNDKYIVGTDVYDESNPVGSTTLPGANYLGCDSTVHVELTFLPTSTGTYVETFCQGSGASVMIGMDIYDENNYWGITTLPNANQYGCDSIVQVDLIFLPNTEGSFYKEYCMGSGGSYIVGGDVYDESNPSGSTVLPGANQYGCDSTVNVTLVFNPGSIGTYEESFCSMSGGSYTVGGDTYDEDTPIGSTLLPGANQYGCDSIVNVTLTFLPNSKTSYTETFCEGSGGSYTVGGDTYDESNPEGSTTFPGGNYLGCDSVVVVTLVFLPNSESYIEETLCDDCGVFYEIGDDIYDQNNPTGSTTLPGANYLGCDSTVHVNLTFLPNSEGFYTEEFCEGSGGSYTVGDDTYDESNPSGFTLLAGVNQYGCDSIVNVNLIFNPASEGYYNETFCEGSGGSYTVGGDTYDEGNPSGSTLLSGANQFGCDSTVHVTLTFNPSTTANIVETYCEGSGATLTVGTDVYDETNYWGITTLPGANQYGCDSIVQVDLIFLPNSSSDYAETFCSGSGGSYTVGGDTYDEDNPSGSTILYGANQYGCDSTVNVVLTFNPTSEYYFEEELCNGCGVYYEFGDDVYDQYNPVGITVLPGANQYGCDSIIHVNLIFLPNTHVYIDETYCEGSGDSFTVGNVTYDEGNPSGTTVIYGGNYLGCDSIVHVNLIFEHCNDTYCTCPVSHWGQNINYVHDLICDPDADPNLVSPDDKLIVGSWELSSSCINYILPGYPAFDNNDVHCGVTYSDVTPLLQYIIAIKIAMIQYDLGELTSYDAEDLKTLELDDICFATDDQAAIDALPANIVTILDLLAAAEANMDPSFTDAIVAVNDRFIDCTSASECPVEYREAETMVSRELKTFPNPATNLVNVQLTIEYEQYIGKEAQYHITNVQGKVVMTGTQHLTEGMNQIQLNTEKLPNGMYIVNLSVEALHFKPEMIFIEK